MTRVKAAATRAPQSTEAATALLVKFSAIDLSVAVIEAARAEVIGAANAKADAELVPLLAEQKDIVKQLKPWWEASVDALTGGKRKSIELGGCVLGYRMTPPKVVFAGGKDEDAVRVLTGEHFFELTRVKPTLDKPAILKMLDLTDSEDAWFEPMVLNELGFSAQQKEEFFVDRAGKALDLGDAKIEA